MNNYDVVIDKTIDQFITDTGYDNVPWGNNVIYVSEAATLSQTDLESVTFLYVVDLILGENSTNSAVVKTGFLDITKSDFDLILVLAGAPVPDDVICPLAAGLTQVTMQQSLLVPQGRSTVTASWDIPVNKEPTPQVIGIATGGVQALDLTFDPVVTGSETVLEITGYAGPAAVTVDPFTSYQDIIQVTTSASFVTGDYIEVDDIAHKEYYRVTNTFPGLIQVSPRCGILSGFASGANVQKVNVLVKINPTAYTVDYTLGIVHTVAGQFTSGNKIAAIYSPVMQNLHHFELYRVPGDLPVTESLGYSQVTKDDVLAAPGMVLVDDAVPNTQSEYTETMPPSTNGETWTYYLFAVDSTTNTNVSWASAGVIETIPSIPTQPGASVGNQKVVVSWQGLPGSSDGNTDGFNIYRSNGSVFDESVCIRVNSTIIPKTIPEFEDSPDNLINRRPSSEVPFPVNGSVYSYKIESEDTITFWDTGTKNQDVETGASNYVASKSL